MRWHETWIAAVFVLHIIIGVADSLRGSELVLAAKLKAAEEKLNPTTEEVSVLVNEDGTNTTVVKAKPLLTGIPQKDYIHDPNLPRELKGHNLTNYPFYNAVPDDIEFECDGLHDGFYASVPHRCQLYHHCLFGTRYDFLCANYTAFDQKTFICHFVSEVDCENSPKYYNRNEALYQQETSPPPPSTTTVRTTPTTTTTLAPPKKHGGGRRKRPVRVRPVYEYEYDDDDDYYDEEYYDDEEEEELPPPPPPRKQGRRPHQRHPGSRKVEHTSTTTTSTTAAPLPADAPLTRAPASVYAPKVPPKINRPVPIDQKNKYEYTTKAGTHAIKPTRKPLIDDELDDVDDDYDDYEDYEDLPRTSTLPPKKKESGHRKNGRRRVHHERMKRPSRYDDDYDALEEERPRRKGNRKGSMEDDYRPRGRGNSGKRKVYREDDYDPIPSERPGYISSRGSSRKRYQEERPKKSDRWRSQEYDYFDDEEDETSRYEEERRRPQRPKADKMRPRSVKKTTTTPSTTTTKATTELTSVEEEDEYEEYDDVAPVEEVKSRYHSSGPNPPKPTNEPHRFSTPNYKNSKQTVQTTTEAITRQKTQPVTYRRSKPDFRRPTTKQPETFLSLVGTPEGFKKPEGEVKVKKTDPLPRRPYNITEETNYRRPAKIEELSSTEVKQLEKADSVSEEKLTTNHKEFKEEVTDTIVSRPETVRSSEEIPNIRRPAKQDIYFPGVSSAETDIKSESEDSNPLLRRPSSRPEFSAPVSGLEKRPDDSYRKFPRPGVFTPTAPDNLPVVQVYRRPFIPSPPDNNRRPAEETLAVRRPLKQDSFSSLPTSVENGFRRPYLSTVTGEGGSRRPEDQNRRPVKQDLLITSEPVRRPGDGMPVTAAGYRRLVRPVDKEKKKTLEELAYPGRRTKENPTTSEPVTERGPNYRNPFAVPRPVKEEPEYFKPPKTVEFTAPGPSGEGSTARPFPVYDIDEEYDVTLNDALQPSTLNPTLQFARVKSRGYQSAVTHPSYHSLLLPSASQTFYSKTPAHSNDDFETVVLPAARFTQPRFKQRRPAEWYW